MRQAQGTALNRAAPGIGRRIAVLGLFLGLGLAAGSSALTLGDLQVQSTLGEPLSALVRVDPGAQETIRRECFSAGGEAGALPGVPNIENLVLVLEQRATGTHLRMLSRAPVREPLAQVVLRVRCPGLPSMTRSFMVLLDPGWMFKPTTTLADRTPALPVVGSAGAIRGDIPPGSLYTVRPGDTLSGVAARIDGRPPYSVWPLASRIRDLNPAAFENGRADALIAGARLTIPSLDQVATSASRSAARSGVLPSGLREFEVNQRPAATPVDPSATVPASQVQPVATSGYPVLVAEAAGPQLEYFVITTRLSELSVSRIQQRVEQAAVAAPVDEAPSAPAASLPAPAEASAPWYSIWWYWALALVLLALGGLAAYRFGMGREQPALEAEDSTPWELGEEADSVVEELQAPTRKVYDDFAGTFVEPAPAAETVPLPTAGKDPEEDVQTHLMPALTDLPPTDEQPEEPPAPRVSPAGADTQKINVEAVDDVSADDEEHGWLELDFEATQILEQDYLAEYAASLKNKIKERSEQQDDEADEDSDDDSVLAASELIRALDEDLISAETLELADDDSPTRELASADDLMSEDESETSEMPTVELDDDNIVSIGKAKKGAGKNKDGTGSQLKDSKKS